LGLSDFLRIVVFTSSLLFAKISARSWESDWELRLRIRDRLTALTVRQINEPGLHPDGGGLHLQVSPSGTKSWILKFQLNGRARAMGLGSLHFTSLAKARDARDAAHRLLRDGIDPIEVRKAELQRKRAAPAKTMTFREAAVACIKDREAEWHNSRHAQQWAATISDYAYPIIGDLPVQVVGTALVMKVLQQEIRDEGKSPLPLWRARPETASRLRGRIETILDWAKVRGHREGENPARWRGHLDKLLPRKSKIAKVKHHEAMDYRQIGALMMTLRADTEVAARALEFLILTAARTGEVIGALWEEIDFRARLWTVPADRMKAGKEHRVPLSGAAMAILEAMREQGRGKFVFVNFAVLHKNELQRAEERDHRHKLALRLIDIGYLKLLAGLKGGSPEEIRLKEVRAITKRCVTGIEVFS
jgi:integrase